ncbi:MAG: TatD family hydrolase [Desulfosarcina sp.]|jgi:TatD DNase family protein
MTQASFRLVDSHAHICDPGFDDDRPDVLARAQRAGVEAIVAVGETLADARKNVALAHAYPILKAAAGLYPTILDHDQADELVAFIRQHRSRLVAIGEVGLDYWKAKDDSQKAVQREIFKRFIDLSLELNLPLNVHSRSAGRHAVALLLECGARRVQMHAYDGKAASVLPAVEAGFYFSVPPSISRSRQKQKLIKQLPLACLLVETDSPVLGPDPQARNEPSNLCLSIQAIAQIKALHPQAVTEAVAENAFHLYGDLGMKSGDGAAAVLPPI